MALQLFVVVVVKAFDGRVFDRAVHAPDLAVGPWVVRFCEAMIDTVGRAAQNLAKHHPSKAKTMRVEMMLPFTPQP